ncbi:MAG: NHLP leader peptide family natural product precursor [Planctomycetes bacterium]|nr:NHLP leader peptide family natural product precursor [Planctomycetota bacterium]
MTEQKNNLAKLFADCWKDADLKARFIANPAFVLAEYGMEVPEGVHVNVVENSDNTVHITLPAAPDNHAVLSDDELDDVAGGTYFLPSLPATPNQENAVCKQDQTPAS